MAPAEKPRAQGRPSVVSAAPLAATKGATRMVSEVGEKKLSKSERKQARRELIAAATSSSAAPLSAPAPVVHFAAPATDGAWIERERAWEETEGKARMRLSYMGAALFLLPLLGVFQVLSNRDDFAPKTYTFAEVALVVLVLLLGATLRSAHKPVKSPLLEVWAQRRHEVVWVYLEKLRSISTGAGGSVSSERERVMLALADGTLVGTQGSLEPGDFAAIASALPHAVKGYTDARRAAFRVNPSLVR